MSVEILTVGLDEATIAKLASKVADELSARFVVNSTTESNPPSSNTHRTQSAPVSDDPGPAEPTTDDPWLNEQGPQEPAATQTSTRAQQPRGGNVEKDKWGGKWELGLPGAPECDCVPGQPAARVTAKSQKTGKWYKSWRCAEGAPKTGNWQTKCDYFEFPQRESNQA